MNSDDQNDVADAEIVGRVCDILGVRLTAYIASVKETRIVRAWAAGTEPPSPEVSQRLRLAFQIAAEIAQHEGKEVTQAWFMGMNPLLDDVSPARLIRESDPVSVRSTIASAAQDFIA